MKLTKDFYQSGDVVNISRQLLGKKLCTNINNQFTSGIITETEAYAGVLDKASHAFGGKRTRRTEIMYHEGGKSYIYLCYGMHHLFNVVTNIEGIPHAVLIRALKIEDGINIAVKRRKSKTKSQLNTKGPATLTQALGITIEYNALDLNGDILWIEDVNRHPSEDDIQVGPRIGVDYAGEDAQLPYRFWINE